jgi:hypothetical protein
MSLSSFRRNAARFVQPDGGSSHGIWLRAGRRSAFINHREGRLR